ncbi:MAG: serine/threonine protein kinase, partial [Clostridia bacterium]|nr:serine/threonine protein kinase [Clostridia bacterium]
MNSCEYHTAYNTKLLDRLEPLAELGASATLCMLRGTHTLYVVKHLPASLLSMLQALAKAVSPRIADLRAFRCYGDEIEAAFDYADGETLHARLESSGPMEAVSAAHICMDVCEGLAALHSVGVVHRDINPNNIVLTRDGRAVIIDCGIARSFLGERTADTMILGTPGYAAPEQFGFTQSDARTDLYAVGVLFNVMITGELPNETLAAEKPGKIVSRCIAIDAKNRPASAEEL